MPPYAPLYGPNELRPSRPMALEAWLGQERQAAAFDCPPGRQQAADGGLVEAVVDQVDHALVVLGADHPAGGPAGLLSGGGGGGVAMKAPIRRSPGRSMPSPKAPPSTAKPMPWLVLLKRSRKAWRWPSSICRDCCQIGICGWAARNSASTRRR